MADNPIVGFTKDELTEMVRQILAEIPSSLPANGGNADTVNGRHAYRIPTLNANANLWDANAENINDAYLQFDGSKYFKLKTFGGIPTKVDYATDAGSLKPTIIGTAKYCVYHTILAWANSVNGMGQAVIVSNEGYPSDIPINDEGMVTVEADPGTLRKVVTFKPYNSERGTYRRNIWNGDWRWEWQDISNGGNADYATNAGNADTVDNKHYTDFSQNAVLTSIEQVNDSNLESGIYSVEGVGITFQQNIISTFYVLIVNKHRKNPGYGTQIAIPYDGGLQRGVYYRNCNSGAWRNWDRIADESLLKSNYLLSNNASKTEYYEIPDGVDVPVWIYQNAKRYTRYITPSGISNRTNLPDNHTASMIRYTFDGMTINAFTENPRKRYITDMVGGSFSSWKEISTTQIDSTTITGTTDANGNVPLWALSNGMIPISAYSTSTIDIICMPFVAANEIWYLAVDSAWTHDKLANTSIIFTVNYIRI